MSFAPSIMAAEDWRVPTEQQFAAFIQHYLTPAMDACEQQRRANVRKLWKLAAVMGALAAGAAAIILAGGGGAAALAAPLIAVMIFAIGYYRLQRDYRRRFKLDVVAAIVRFFGPDFVYEPEACISLADFRRSLIFQQKIDRYHGEDKISGAAGRTRFEFSEVHAEYMTTHTDSKGRQRTQWHTLFKGLFFIGDFNKHFSGVTLVLPDMAQAALGWLGQKLQSINFTRPGELVKLEDPDFEKLFVVYGTDQVEARYILSPSLMRRLVEFRQVCGRKLSLSFVDGCVFVALETGRNLLEPPVRSVVDYDACHSVYSDLSFALGIIEELNLNTRIWSKR